MSSKNIAPSENMLHKCVHCNFLAVRKKNQITQLSHDYRSRALAAAGEKPGHKYSPLA